jgi:hypothetical protein
MITFKEFYSELYAAENEKRLLCEYQCYQLIPGTRNSFREDPMNTSTKTEKHSHVYARPKGGGRQLYAVTIHGKGHDGSTGKEIPPAHADFFRSKGYTIPNNNQLECIDMNHLNGSTHQIIFG